MGKHGSSVLIISVLVILCYLVKSLIKMNLIQVYTDGSCNTKLKVGAWAAIILYKNSTKTISGYELDTTNNRMELTAVIKAFEYIEKNNSNINKIELFSDSQYVVRLPEREERFIENNFITKKGKFIQNVDLVKTLLGKLKIFDVDLIKVKAHQKKTEKKNYNIDVDKLSRKIVRKYIADNSI